ncbi:LysR substrate-binding domain-containing protein [Tunturiibacter gelidiferens]|uniref:LysR substrate-binding domain-containing protein n=1 Tax=Tunturiibacter gelidiferens TaxID=3069689 RepID=UPI003D9BD2B3
MFTRLPFLIKRYRRLHPKVELQLQELVTTELMCALREGALDLGFMRDGEPDSAITIEPLLSERFVAILPKTASTRRQNFVASRRSARGAVRLLREKA